MNFPESNLLKVLQIIFAIEYVKKAIFGQLATVLVISKVLCDGKIDQLAGHWIHYTGLAVKKEYSSKNTVNPS